MAARVTLGLPVYNGERYVAAALESLLSQTYADFELIISDNASEDGTQGVCEDYARRDRRIRYVRHGRNRGAVSNFNELARMAETPLFHWHAVDDLCRPRFLEVCVERLEREPQAVIAFTAATSIDENGDPVPQADLRLPTDSPDVTERFASCLDPTPYSWNALYGTIRTETLKRTHLHADFPGGDRALTAELSLYGPFVRVEEPLFLRRVHRQALSGEEEALYVSGRREVSLREWRILRQNLASIRRAPLRARERRSLYAAVLRRLVRKRRGYLLELKKGLGSALR